MARAYIQLYYYAHRTDVAVRGQAAPWVFEGSQYSLKKYVVTFLNTNLGFDYPRDSNPPANRYFGRKL